MIDLEVVRLGEKFYVSNLIPALTSKYIRPCLLNYVDDIRLLSFQDMLMHRSAE